MPGPVSDSYDPEFSTTANAQLVRESTQGVVSAITEVLGPQLHSIVQVCERADGPKLSLQLSERQWRIIRFNLLRSLETY